ncbi:P-loop NTPase [Thermodesulfobacterium hveragerdense]|uniref:P-loop NTPase n=1 Tax=Thermodesulfobacterium hveragerdense TaxID=53424 RepID=UPI00041CDB38|nr:ATP-binding protein [Thermodesulfobacterium hveragerdense]
MIISVASGKGGTGKTTVAISLALTIGDAQIIDCDVEEPNVRLFLTSEIKETYQVNTLIPEIDKEKCTYCGYCSKICVYNALSVLKFEQGGEVFFFSHLCHGCGGCILLCPEKAIYSGFRPIGEITKGVKEGIEFIEGKLNISEVLAPKVIEEAKKFIDPDKIAIIDAPPGTSCPAVASIKGSGFCILVTEPTPFGLHDLELAYEMTKVLNIPAGVIINKSQEDKIVENFCEKVGLPILMKIPFKREIAEVYSKGIPLVVGMPEYQEKFLNLIEAIRGFIR